MSKTTAKEYIELTHLWENTDKGIVIDNLERLIGYVWQGNKNSLVVEKLMLMAEASNHTVRAWTNRSRLNVKIPLLKLCQIAEHLGVDVFELFKTIKVDRRWDSNKNINERQRGLFNQIDESEYFKDGEWDVKGLIQRMDELESYSNGDAKTILEKDCVTYFMELLGMGDSGKFIASITEYIEKYMEGKLNA